MPDRDELMLILRLGGTSIIWIMLGIIVTSVGETSSPFTFIIMLMVTVVALLSTLAIWDKIEVLLGQEQADSKRKNENRDADAALMLLQLLSPEEQAAIRHRLIDSMRQDGELPQAAIYEEQTPTTDQHGQ